MTEECRDHPYALEIINRSDLPFTIIGNNDVPEITGLYPYNLNQGKQHLLLCRNKGAFFKPCPGTKEYTCCDYQVLNIGMNCPMDCVYCILQAYLNNPWMTFFVNIEDMFEELNKGLAEKPDTFFRIGTGEFTDSLGIDSLTNLSSKLVNFIGKKNNAVLELKTKSNVIENLEHASPNGRSVIAWSLNSPSIMQKDEIRTASLQQRLEAAARVAEWGYLLAFHFDPIIYHQGWEEGYRDTIQKLYEMVPADKIVWISLGALRYLPSLKGIATERFPSSTFFYEEFVPGLDGKYRYFRPERVKMYKLLYEELKKKADDHTCIYFCMESSEIWHEVFGYTPEEKGGLPDMLDKAVRYRSQ